MSADFLKGLIKLAAAGVKQLEGRQAGVTRHLSRARELFTTVGQRHLGPEFLGLGIEALTAIDKLPTTLELASPTS